MVFGSIVASDYFTTAMPQLEDSGVALRLVGRAFAVAALPKPVLPKAKAPVYVRRVRACAATVVMEISPRALRFVFRFFPPLSSPRRSSSQTTCRATLSAPSTSPSGALTPTEHVPPSSCPKAEPCSTSKRGWTPRPWGTPSTRTGNRTAGGLGPGPLLRRGRSAQRRGRMATRPRNSKKGGRGRKLSMLRPECFLSVL